MDGPVSHAFTDADDVRHRLDAIDYLVDDGMATALFLAVSLGRPLLLEGEPGVGKTAAAKALARVLDAPLIRLQCYEGLDVAHAVYEWNYARQLLHIRAAQEGTVDEAGMIRAALDAGVGYIGLVASRKRGAAVLAEMTLTDAERGRVHTPAGLDIGARNAPEVALSIVAEIVKVIRTCH